MLDVIYLVHHTIEEWAGVTELRLVDLGCSPSYAAIERERILANGVEVASHFEASALRRKEVTA